MGKKSLFQPTGGSGKAKKEAGAKKTAGKKKTAETKKSSAPKKAIGKKTAIKAAATLPPEAVVSQVEEHIIPAPDLTVQAPETAPPAAEPEPQNDIVAETPAAPAAETASEGDIVAEMPVAPVVEAESGPMEANTPVAETGVSEEAAAAEPVPDTAVAPAENADLSEPDMTAPPQEIPEPPGDGAAEAPVEVAPVAAPESVVDETPSPAAEVGASADAGGVEPEPTPVPESTPAPEKEAAVEAALPTVEPEPEKEPPAPVPASIAVEVPAAGSRDVETTIPTMSVDPAPFGNDPLIGRTTIVAAIAGVCALILILFIASAANSGRYYMKEIKGAVKIWKGTFTPAGKERIMILHGAHWVGPSRASYSREEVFAFATRYYLEKALSLTEDPVSKDFDRMTYYLGRAGEMAADGESREAAAVIRQANEYMSEVQTLQSSGEQAASALAREKLKAVGQALKALVAGFTENGGEPVGGAAGH